MVVVMMLTLMMVWGNVKAFGPHEILSPSRVPCLSVVVEVENRK